MALININNEVKDKILNVGQLIELLEKCPKDALVYHEGCDCYGEADRVEFDESDNTILIGRCN